MNSKYELLKDINSPIGSCNAGVIGKDDGSGRIWFENQYWNKETCETEPEWFLKIEDRIDVTVNRHKEYADPRIKSTGIIIRPVGDHGIAEWQLPLIKKEIERVLNDDPWQTKSMKEEEITSPPQKITGLIGVTIKGRVVDYNNSASIRIEGGFVKAIAIDGEIFIPQTSIQQELDKAREEAFDAARKLDFGGKITGYMGIGLQYPTLQDYIKSIK